MSKNFKVGDRVALYTEHNIRYTGTIKNITPSGGICALVDGLEHVEPLKTQFHPKQCRLLLKKPRRRIWVRFNKDTDFVQGWHLYGTNADLATGTIQPSGDGWVPFVEVKRK
jgi:hypothetical protein